MSVRPLRLSRALLGAAAVALLAGAATAAPSVEKSAKLAPGLYEIVFNPADGDAYVASVGPRGGKEAKVLRVNGKTLETVGAIAVADTPAFGLGINTKTQVLYATDTRGGVVVLMDLKSGKVLAILKAGDKAHLREVIVDEASNLAYATVVGGAADDPKAAANEIWVIDEAKQKIDRVIKVKTGTLTGVALDAANQRLFATGMGANEVVAIDLKTDAVTHSWPAGGERPTNLVHDPAGSRLFVANQGTGDLTVLSTKDGKLIHRTPTGGGALSVAHNPAVGQIYVANRQAGTVTVVSDKTYEVLANLKTGTFPQTIAIDRASNLVYVTNKARGLPRDAPAGTPTPDDPNGDTVTLIHP